MILHFVSALLLASIPSSHAFNNLFSSSASSTKAALPKLTLPDGFQAPTPRAFTVSQLDWLPNMATGSIVLLLRQACGATTIGWKPAFEEAQEGEYSLKLGGAELRDQDPLLPTLKRPSKPLVLYDYELSPYCRVVREAASKLDINLEIRPCPRGGTVFRKKAETAGGKQQFPYLEDPNTRVSLYESLDIVNYLFDQYGPGADNIPGVLKASPLFAGVIAVLLRGGAGSARNADAFEENALRKPIELWAYDGSPFVRPVREKLTELELPHILITCSRGSPKRDELVKRTGTFQVPYIFDPNTGVEMFESQDICQYLDQVYTSC
ncbi:unnamed protein product [Chrysoparadoxa australica]